MINNYFYKYAFLNMEVIETQIESIRSIKKLLMKIIQLLLWSLRNLQEYIIVLVCFNNTVIIY